MEDEECDDFPYRDNGTEERKLPSLEYFVAATMTIEEARQWRDSQRRPNHHIPMPTLESALATKDRLRAQARDQ